MACLKSAFRSAPFKFLVEGEPFYAHAKLVSRHSDPLGALIKTPMEESKHGFAVLPDVSAEIFARFLKWIYQGFYTTPDPVRVTLDASNKEVSLPEFSPANSKVVDIAKPPAEDNFWGASTSPTRKKKIKKAEKID